MYLIADILFLFLYVNKYLLPPLPMVPLPHLILNLFRVKLKASGSHVTGYFHYVGARERSGGAVTCKVLLCVPYFFLITSLKIISDRLKTS